MQRHMHHQLKPVKNSRQFRFMSFMRNGITDAETLENPMAVYEWFITEWDRPLNNEGMRLAWLAAWAITIHDGSVDL